MLEAVRPEVTIQYLDPGLVNGTGELHFRVSRAAAANDTTAHLMARFYRRLRDGDSKDEALRKAQLELIRSPIPVTDQKGELVELDASSPYYWAAFQLIGDWR